MIALIDRFLIMTTCREGKFSWGRLATVASRLILATLIAIVISKPLEMAIFHKEITATIMAINLQAEIDTKAKIAQLTESVQIDRLRQANQALQATSNQRRDQYQQAYDQMIGEAEGTKGTNKVGKGPVFEEKEKELQRQKTLMDSSITQNQKQIKTNNDQITQLQKTLNSKADQLNVSRRNADSILAQMQALHKMAKEDAAVDWASRLITAIFIALDVLPILGKMTMKPTIYEAIEYGKTRAARAWEEEKLKHLSEEIASRYTATWPSPNIPFRISKRPLKTIKKP
jgi:small-conductance mechanosensitive channel